MEPNYYLGKFHLSSVKKINTLIPTKWMNNTCMKMKRGQEFDEEKMKDYHNPWFKVKLKYVFLSLINIYFFRFAFY